MFKRLFAHSQSPLSLTESTRLSCRRRFASPMVSIHMPSRGVVTLPRTPLFEAITSHDPQHTAVIHSLSCRSFTYGSLVQDVLAAKEKLAKDAGRDLKSMEGERIAFVIENGYDYVGALKSRSIHQTRKVQQLIVPSVTLLSILASNAIALPVAPGFPVGELRYILNHAEALMFISSARFADKAAEVLQEGLDHQPISSRAEKIAEGRTTEEQVTLEEVGDTVDKGGMMLYTSGTTSRPVCSRVDYGFYGERIANQVIERSSSPTDGARSADAVSPSGMALLDQRSLPARPPIASHPRYRECATHAPVGWKYNRIYVPVQRRSCMDTPRYAFLVTEWIKGAAADLLLHRRTHCLQ